MQAGEEEGGGRGADAEETPPLPPSPAPPCEGPPGEAARGFEELLPSIGLSWDAQKDLMSLLKVLPRFVRLNVKMAPASMEAARQALLSSGAVPVSWLPARLCFYELPPSYPLASCPLYAAGSVYGMDAASGAAVVALDPQPGEDILDLCCCPGAKLCLMADLMQGRGRLTGVDVSKDRLFVCRKLAIKYGVGDLGGGDGGSSPSFHVRLIEGDGTSFGGDGDGDGDDAALVDVKKVMFDSRVYDWEGMNRRGQSRMSKGEWERERRRLRSLASSSAAPPPPPSGQSHRAVDSVEEPSPPPPPPPPTAEREGGGAATWGHGQRGYDRVLVDAECTHDGSLRHMAKVMELSPERLNRGFLNTIKLQSLEDLQRGLLSNGFRLLRSGGVLVYSTCSLSRGQNECIVEHLLRREPTARVEHLLWLEDGAASSGSMTTARVSPSSSSSSSSSAAGAASSSLPPCRVGELPGTYYFEPRLGTSGLFVCRIRKEDGEMVDGPKKKS